MLKSRQIKYWTWGAQGAECSTSCTVNWQSYIQFHWFLSICMKIFFCLASVAHQGVTSKHVFVKMFIAVVFGGWFEGSQKDFLFDYSNALVLINLRKNVLLFDKCCNTSFMASLSLRGCQICKYKSLLCLRGEIVFYIMQIQRTSMSICMQWARQTFSTKDLENTFPLTSFKHHSSGGNRIFSSQGQA